MRRVLAQIAIAISMTGPLLQGQSLSDQVNFRAGELGGLRLYGVTVFSGYSTSAYPVGLGQGVPVGFQELGGTASYGASASLGWQLHRRRTDVAVMYSGTYGGSVRYSDLNAYNQSLGLSISRRLAPKWVLAVSAYGSDYSMAEFLHQPATLSVVSQLPVSFDDLAAAFSIGQFSNTQIASMLTGAPALPASVRAQLLGNRVLSYSVQAGLNYSYSPRLQFHFSSVSASGRSWRGGRHGIPREAQAQPNGLGLNAGLTAGFSYALSPRTQVGFNLEENYIWSRYYDRHQGGFNTSASASLGRKMGGRWFLHLHGGGSMLQPIRQSQSYILPRTRQVIGGGALGLRLSSHTLVASYNRGSFDNYGLAPGTNTSLSGNWAWTPRGRRWALFIGAGQQQMRGTGFISLSGWEASAGSSVRVNSQTTAVMQYVYLDSKGSYLGNNNNFSVHSIRLSVGWTPQPVRR